MESKGVIFRPYYQGQSNAEYAIVVTWALVIVSVAIVGLYFFVPSNPTGSQTQVCSFDTGAYCYDFTMGANAIAGSSSMLLLADNQNQYPLINPKMTMNINGFNTSPMSCMPNYVAPGESFICTASIWGSGLSAGKYFKAPVYVQARYCGLNSSFVSGLSAGSCAAAPVETYEGTVAGYVVNQESNTIGIQLSAQTYNAIADGSYDNIYATVTAFGTPIRSAGINFTVNSTNFKISSPFVMSAANGGVATTSIYATQGGNVVVSAAYGSYTTNIIIEFQQAT